MACGDFCVRGRPPRGLGTPAMRDFEDTCREYSWSRRLLAGAAGMWLMLVEALTDQPQLRYWAWARTRKATLEGERYLH